MVVLVSVRGHFPALAQGSGYCAQGILTPPGGEAGACPTGQDAGEGGGVCSPFTERCDLFNVHDFSVGENLIITEFQSYINNSSILLLSLPLFFFPPSV